MAKRFKFKFSFPSLHFCRSKHPSTFPETPTRAIYRLPAFNPKGFDVGYPNLPAPPPSTPVSKIVSVGCGCCRSRSCAHNNNESSDNESHDYRLKKYGIAKAHEAKYGRKSNYEEKKSNAKGSKSVSSRDGAWFSSEDETENKTLLSTSRSLSNESSYEFDRSLQTVAEIESGGFHKKKKGKRNGSMNRKGSGIGQSKASPVVRVWAVVKKSEDPYEDFKRSMWEMILEKQIFEAKELEQLLQCFLSLNWPRYHGVIVAAFSEIWEVLFRCDSPVNPRV